MEARDPLMELLSELEDPEFQAALSKLIEIVRNMEKSGLLDMLAALTDPEVVNRLTEMLLTSGTMEIGDSIDALLNKIGDITAAITSDVEPMSLSKLLLSLKDPQVVRGLARLILILKALGKQ